jgi:hypothetical protein
MTELAASAPEPAAPAPNPDAILSAFINTPREAPKAEPTPAETPAKGKEPEHLAAANGRKPPKEPLDPLDFDPETLKTPEEMNAVKERIIKARRQALELTRASHRSHAAAEQRERKLLAKEQGVSERETRVAAWERVVSTSVDDLESGDSERFLTAVGKLSKSGDPAGFWRNAALSLAKGEKLKPAQAAAVEADPELKQRLTALEQQLTGQRDAEFTAQIEHLKNRNLEAAKTNEASPRVAIYAGDERAAPAIRERLAEIMVAGAKERGRPLTIQEACASLEEELSVHFELSQRADGQTTREKETTSPALESGRDSRAALPTKPETTPVTIPASLSSAPGSATRRRTEAETRAWQIAEAERLGLF